MDLKPLITLLAIVNPLAIVPFFIHYTDGFSPRQRRRTIQVARPIAPPQTRNGTRRGSAIQRARHAFG